MFKNKQTADYAYNNLKDWKFRAQMASKTASLLESKGQDPNYCPKHNFYGSISFDQLGLIEFSSLASKRYYTSKQGEVSIGKEEM